LPVSCLTPIGLGFSTPPPQGQDSSHNPGIPQLLPGSPLCPGVSSIITYPFCFILPLFDYHSPPLNPSFGSFFSLFLRPIPHPPFTSPATPPLVPYECLKLFSCAVCPWRDSLPLFWLALGPLNSHVESFCKGVLSTWIGVRSLTLVRRRRWSRGFFFFCNVPPVQPARFFLSAPFFLVFPALEPPVFFSPCRSPNLPFVPGFVCPVPLTGFFSMVVCFSMRFMCASTGLWVWPFRLCD